MSTRPLRIQFVLTSLPIGGAETLLLNMVRTMDRLNFAAEVVCLKDPGELGPVMAAEVPVHSNFIGKKWDVRVLWRLAKHFQQRQADAVITIGAGDKMFWGRLAAKLANVPVICSALHSTGWPDGVGRLNRLLTPITGGFIAVAKEHAKHMVSWEKFPENKVFMIPNGVDTNRFKPDVLQRLWLRKELKLDSSVNLVGIVAALRHEKNHLQFVSGATQVLQSHPNTHFVIVGDGPERPTIESAIEQTGCQNHFHLLGSRSDTEKIVAGLDVFCLTSRNEANPVSILEALACCVPVVSPNVGSIHETVLPLETGILTEPLDAEETSRAICHLLRSPDLAKQLGQNGRNLVVGNWSLEAMVEGYQSLVEQLYNRAALKSGQTLWARQSLQSETPSIATAAAEISPTVNLLDVGIPTLSPTTLPC